MRDGVGEGVAVGVLPARGEGKMEGAGEAVVPNALQAVSAAIE
jgi:hypothetical protein